MFIVIEGCDGSGKGEQIRRLKSWLEREHVDFVFARDPGATPLGEKIRSVLLNSSDLDICPTAETALFMASRAQLVHDVLAPALNKGLVVITDRYLLSTVIYQGYAVGASDDGIEEMWRIGTCLANHVVPDVTFVLECPFEVAEERLGRRSVKDRMESKDEIYRRKVAEGYLAASELWSSSAHGRIVGIDGTRSPENIAREIEAIVKSMFT